MSAVCLSYKGLLKSARDMFVCMMVFVALCGVAHCGTGCKGVSSPSAADDYTTRIIACAATAGYPGAYDHAADLRCRNGVNCEFGLPSCVK